jgi:hypothetical protein
MILFTDFLDTKVIRPPRRLTLYGIRNVKRDFYFRLAGAALIDGAIRSEGDIIGQTFESVRWASKHLEKARAYCVRGLI